MEQPRINIDLKHTTPLTCDDCRGIYFQEALHIRKASGILTGSTKPTLIPIPVFTCIACGHVNEEFLPKEIQDLD